MHCGSDDFVDVSGMYNPENVVLYADVRVPVTGRKPTVAS
jgi:hypothetical protein